MPSHSEPPVLAALYTGSSASEPGMILVSSTGEVRFWESMSLALANVERYQAIQMELGQDDYVQRIWKCDVSWPVTTKVLADDPRLARS
jgi:nuclear pore complex protein Nup133